MFPQESWQTINVELSQLSNDREYQQYQPLLDSLQQLVDAKYASPEIIKGVLEVVKSIQAHGTPAQEIAKQVEGGFVQPSWTVEGNVNQANHDFINQTFLTIVHNNLKDLKKDEVNLNIKVPIVLLVMTMMEAEELVTLQAFDGLNEQIYTDQFSRYQRALEENQFVNWIQRYGNRPQDWQPFSKDSTTISEVITQALGTIEDYDHPLVPDFIDIRSLNEDNSRRNLRHLRQSGCVTIIDSISIRHPIIQRAYRRTQLDVFPNTLLVKLNPFSDPTELEEQMIRFSERYVDLEFFKRYRVDMDAKCDEVEDDLHFRRWLLDQAPKLLPDDEKAKKGWRKHAYK
ncbi:MAG TPA: hypothetical protein VGC91_08990 [Pyrinomonadaceae bacterium]|jgi:hypothetical protein